MWSRLMLARAEYDQTVGAMTRAQVLTAYAWDAAAGDLVPVWLMTVASESVFNGDDELARADLQPEMGQESQGMVAPGKRGVASARGWWQWWGGRRCCRRRASRAGGLAQEGQVIFRLTTRSCLWRSAR